MSRSVLNAALSCCLLFTACSRFEATPILDAAWENDGATVRAMIEAGTPVSTADIHGYTALHVAASNGDAELVHWLLERGADAHTLTFNQDTVIELAAVRYFALVDQLNWARASRATAQPLLNGYLNIREQLITAGSDPEIWGRPNGL
ncbi:MAG TPA: hypothetical protein DCR55_05630 [Lentisphaeria bacterium]|nr:hypothetical protein [Lentisphaeria bacterium]